MQARAVTLVDLPERLRSVTDHQALLAGRHMDVHRCKIHHLAGQRILVGWEDADLQCDIEAGAEHHLDHDVLHAAVQGVLGRDRNPGIDHHLRIPVGPAEIEQRRWRLGRAFKQCVQCVAALDVEEHQRLVRLQAVVAPYLAGQAAQLVLDVRQGLDHDRADVGIRLRVVDLRGELLADVAPGLALGRALFHGGASLGLQGITRVRAGGSGG